MNVDGQHDWVTVYNITFEYFKVDYGDSMDAIPLGRWALIMVVNLINICQKQNDITKYQKFIRITMVIGVFTLCEKIKEIFTKTAYWF
jgi:hypothetical protein